MAIKATSSSRIVATEYDIDILSRTIWGEAEGEIWMGKVGVAWTVRNRFSKRPLYGTSISSICLKSNQFSCWSNAFRSKVMASLTLDDVVFQECTLAAIAVLHGRISDPTDGATHFLNLAVLKRPPSWFDTKMITKKIGRHTFLKLT